VLQRSRELDLAEEPISIDPGGQLRRQDLEYDAAPQGRIRRGKDATHAAASQFLFQAVGGAHGGLEALSKVGHGTNIGRSGRASD